jgi:hypothetical protein
LPLIITSSLVQYFLVKLNYLSEVLTAKGWLLITLHLSGTNTLAYFNGASLTKKKMVFRCCTWMLCKPELGRQDEAGNCQQLQLANLNVTLVQKCLDEKTSQGEDLRGAPVLPADIAEPLKHLGAIFKKLYILCNLRMGPMSKSVS